jgi:diguanylate cyclase (GGDEF)-like protein
VDVGNQAPNACGAAPAGEVPQPRVDDAIPDRAVGDPADLRRLLAGTELRLRAALRQIERMRRRDAALRRDITQQTEAVLRARRFAYHDELTGLPNRRLLLNRFKLAVALAARHDHQVALLFLDLDRFKYINDTLGHPSGDQLLQQVATRLAASVRASDTACRYGGDEFVVLLPEIGDKEAAAAVADGIRAQLAAPYLIDGAEITITASVGVAVHPVDAVGYSDLFRLADLAMYRDKARSSAAPSIQGWPLDDRRTSGLSAA